VSALVPVFVPILAAVVAALLGIVGYISQKRTDRKVELRKQQREAYECYMESYQNWAYAEEGTDEDEKARDAYRQAYFSLFPLASDGFLRAAMAFHAYAWEGHPDFTKKEDQEDFDELWTDLIIAMRHDANVRSRLTKEDIQDHLPWFRTYWTYQNSGQEEKANETSATSSSPTTQ
jgi:hypothetical protein